MWTVRFFVWLIFGLVELWTGGMDPNGLFDERKEKRVLDDY